MYFKSNFKAIKNYNKTEKFTKSFPLKKGI